MATDLRRVLVSRQRFCATQVQLFLYQILSGMSASVTVIHSSRHCIQLLVLLKMLSVVAGSCIVDIQVATGNKPLHLNILSYSVSEL